MSHLFAPIICLFVLPLCATGLDTLRTQLQKPGAAEVLKASVELQTWTRRGDEKKPVITEGQATAWVESGPQGLRLFWGRDVLAQARQEARLRSEDPEKTTPTRDSIAAMNILSLQNYFEPSGKLLQDLDKATLVEERPDTLDGKPCRLLALKLDPKMNARDRKYVKEVEATAKLWLDADGLPLAAEFRTHVRGTIMLVVSFVADERDEYRFGRTGGHLVTVRHLHENTSSGAGEHGQTRQVATLAFN